MTLNQSFCVATGVTSNTTMSLPLKLIPEENEVLAHQNAKCFHDDFLPEDPRSVWNLVVASCNLMKRGVLDDDLKVHVNDAIQLGYPDGPNKLRRIGTSRLLLKLLF